eukprot:1237079-Pyramimonas_sp.AAC.1
MPNAFLCTSEAKRSSVHRRNYRARNTDPLNVHRAFCPESAETLGQEHRRTEGAQSVPPYIG